MWTALENFFLAFVPLFVAIDVVGIIPLFINLTQQLAPSKRRQLVTQATITAFCVAILFLTCGKLLFSFLRISENDFRVAGGLVLLVLSISDLVYSTLQGRRTPDSEDLGVVPIGIPLIVGPAVLTTILISVDSYGFFPTFFALFTNLVIVWFVFQNSHVVIKVLGKSGSRAVAKVMALFLAAIAVMMIRVGLMNMVKG